MKLLSALLVSAAFLVPMTFSTAPVMAAGHGTKHAVVSHGKSHKHHRGHHRRHQGRKH